jgi:hypothetical protein
LHTRLLIWEVQLRVLAFVGFLTSALLLAPVALTAQELKAQVPAATVFASVSPSPLALTPRQSSGEKSPTVAALLNVLLLPGIGNFYAGNNGHGFRHLAIAAGGGLIFALGAVDALIASDNGPRGGEGDALLVIGGVVLVGNSVWSIFSGISDARAAGSPAATTASMIRPRLVPLALPHAVGDPSGMATHRLGLQLVRFGF